MIRHVILILTLVAVSLLGSTEVQAQARSSSHNASYVFETDAQERQFRQLINEIRCPKCQNQSIADSDSPLAQDLRERVYQMTLDGHSREEIIDFMRERYGDFVHYRPPVNATTIILWAGPGAVFLIGVLTVALMVRTQKKRQTTLTAEEQARLNDLLSDEKRQDEIAQDKKEQGR